MILSQDDLTRRILETHAVSIWNREKGPIFWYAAGTPGPFYVNTELVLGAELSGKLLSGITSVVEGTSDSALRAQKLAPLMMESFEKDDFYQSIIATMAVRAQESFGPGAFSFVSGGERRDWLFSIPLARVLGVEHIYLFKNGEAHCENPWAPGAKTLHVSDLVNNAASHFDAWFPILEKNGLSCPGTVCVNTRGTNGLSRLEAVGHKVVALNGVGMPFFETCCRNGLIGQEIVDEMRLFFDDPRTWASACLMDRPELFDITRADKKTLERIGAFVRKDPWNLRPRHESFFATLEKAL